MRTYTIETEYDSDDGVTKDSYEFFAEDDNDAIDKIPFGEFGTRFENWRSWESTLWDDRNNIVKTGW